MDQMTETEHSPPPWQDLATLARNICCGESTIEAWVRQGKFPPPRKRNGKNFWKWTEVERFLENGGDAAQTSEVQEGEAIREATRRASHH